MWQQHKIGQPKSHCSTVPYTHTHSYTYICKIHLHSPCTHPSLWHCLRTPALWPGCYWGSTDPKILKYSLAAGFAPTGASERTDCGELPHVLKCIKHLSIIKPRDSDEEGQRLMQIFISEKAVSHFILAKFFLVKVLQGWTGTVAVTLKCARYGWGYECLPLPLVCAVSWDEASLSSMPAVVSQRKPEYSTPWN